MFWLLLPFHARAECAALDVCDTFADATSLAGSDCPSDAWAGPWTLEGQTQRSNGRISLREEDTRITRAFAVNAAHENVFLSLQWGTEGSKRPDTASISVSSNGGASFATLAHFDGAHDSQGQPYDTWTALVSLPSHPPDGLVHVAVEISNKYNNKGRWFHVFSVRAESSCSLSAPVTPHATSPPAPSPSAPASCAANTCLEQVSVVVALAPAPDTAVVSFSGQSAGETCVSNVLIAVPACANAANAYARDCLGNPLAVDVNRTSSSCGSGSYPSLQGQTQYVKVDVPSVPECEDPQQFHLTVPGAMASVGSGEVLGLKGATTCCEVSGEVPVFSCLPECTSDADCPRNFASKCTVPVCGSDGTCGFAGLACPTEHPCVSGACDEGTGLCAYTRDWACCDPALSPQQECHHPGDPCLSARCHAGLCHLEPVPNCCSHDAQCAHLAEPCNVPVCDHTTRQCAVRSVHCPADMDGDLHCTVPVCSAEAGGVCVETAVTGNAKCGGV